jgi:hypothetical protein
MVNIALAVLVNIALAVLVLVSCSTFVSDIRDPLIGAGYQVRSVSV